MEEEEAALTSPGALLLLAVAVALLRPSPLAAYFTHDLDDATPSPALLSLTRSHLRAANWVCNIVTLKTTRLE